jgi:hypothetical protein
MITRRGCSREGFASAEQRQTAHELLLSLPVTYAIGLLTQAYQKVHKVTTEKKLTLRKSIVPIECKVT